MKGRLLAIAAVIAVIVAAFGVHYAISSAGDKGKISLFSADAYLQESNTLLSSFENSTGTGYLPVKSGGSFDMASEIGQGETATNFLSVSLSSYNHSFMGSHYSGWAVAFASDQLALAYAPASSGNSIEMQIVHNLTKGYETNNTSELNAGYTMLTSGKVRVGISDPLSDPAGYRGWISLEIAGKLFADNSSLYVHRIVSNNGNTTASSAAELVSPLEVGDIQFLFIYRSAAIAKGLDFINLSNYTDLGDPNLSSFYSNFHYNYSGTTFTGTPIYLFMSDPAAEPYANIAQNFTEFTIEHSSLLTSYGIDPLQQGILFNSTVPPSFLQNMIKAGTLRDGGPI